MFIVVKKFSHMSSAFEFFSSCGCFGFFPCKYTSVGGNVHAPVSTMTAECEKKVTGFSEFLSCRLMFSPFFLDIVLDV